MNYFLHILHIKKGVLSRILFSRDAGLFVFCVHYYNFIEWV